MNSTVTAADVEPSAAGAAHVWVSVIVIVSPTNGAAYDGTSAGIDRVQEMTTPPSSVSVTSTEMSCEPVRSPFSWT